MAEGNGEPTKNLDTHWYIDKTTNLLYTDWDGEWESLEMTGVDDYFFVTDLLIVHSSSGWCLFDFLGQPMWVGDALVRGDSLIVMWDSRNVHVFAAWGQSFTPEFGIPQECYAPWKLDTVMGEVAVCLHDLAMPEWTPCDERRGWGMRSTNGRWIVQPIYDESFHFVNGVAEVVYYGEKRRINTKGEVLN